MLEGLLIGLETALTAIGQGTKDVAVAVLDGGGPLADTTADTTSAFLPGGFDFVDFDNDPTDPQSSSGSHGIHVGSTIAALNDGNNINIILLLLRTAAYAVVYYFYYYVVLKNLKISLLE